MQATLIYVHDPMCSWCYGFEATRRQLFESLDPGIAVVRLLGGLAADSDQPMAEDTRRMIRQTWRRIEQMIPGVRFNHEFWDKNEPRRSTYPSNRAVIAAREQGEEFDAAMTARIQQAYYREARNPSLDDTLVELAADLGLDRERFARDLNSDAVRQRLAEEIDASRAIGVSGFPSLALQNQAGIRHIGLNYNDALAMLAEIHAAA